MTIRDVGGRPMHSRGNAGRVTLERELLPIALLTVQAGGPSATSSPGEAAALEQAGLARRGRPTRLARKLLEPVAHPRTVVTVQEVGATGTRATIWKTRDAATVGFCIIEGTYALDRIKPGFLGFALASLMELGIRPEPERERVIVDRASIVAMRNTGRVRHWQLSSMSSLAGEVTSRDLELLDCGSGGYWELAETGEGALLLEPRSLEAVLHLLSDADRRGP